MQEKHQISTTSANWATQAQEPEVAVSTDNITSESAGMLCEFDHIIAMCRIAISEARARTPGEQSLYPKGSPSTVSKKQWMARQCKQLNNWFVPSANPTGCHGASPRPIDVWIVITLLVRTCSQAAQDGAKGCSGVIRECSKIHTCV